MGASVFKCTEVPGPTTSTLQTFQLSSRPERQRSARSFSPKSPSLASARVGLAGLAPKEPGVMRPWQCEGGLLFLWQSWGISVGPVEGRYSIPVAFQRSLSLLEFGFKWGCSGFEGEAAVLGIPRQQWALEEHWWSSSYCKRPSSTAWEENGLTQFTQILFDLVLMSACFPSPPHPPDTCTLQLLSFLRLSG